MSEPPRRPGAKTWALLLITALALATLAGMVQFWGAAGITTQLGRGLPALPAALAVHLTQLALSAFAWRRLLPTGSPATLWTVLRARWVREALNTLLPAGGISGAAASTSLLARSTGLTTGTAAASVTGDLTCEAIAQAPALAAALLVTSGLAPAALSPRAVALALGPLCLGIAGFVLAQRWGLMGAIERAGARLGFGAAMAGLHEGLMALHARPARIAQATMLHTISWCLGGAEVWAVLHTMGQPVTPASAFALEGLGMAARSLGFLLPAGLAAQEAGFAAAGLLLGIPAQASIAMSLVKRVRELAVGGSGLLLWAQSRRTPPASA